MRDEAPHAIIHGPALPSSVWLPRSVADVLPRAANTLIHVRADGSESHSSYGALRVEAERILGGLRRHLSRGDRIVFQLGDPELLLPSLWGCFLGGFVPVLLAPATGRDDGNLTARRYSDTLRRIGRPVVLTSADRAPLAAREGVEVLSVEELREGASDAEWTPGSGDDVALLMLTSGSTDAPKLVRLTHDNIAASIAASAFVNGYAASDVSLNWLPLHHIGALMRSLREVYVGCRQIQVATAHVADDPMAWLDLLSEHGVTMTWGPNAVFASLVARRSELSWPRGWALQTLRSVYSSGEPIIASTMRDFVEMLAPYGLDAVALHAAWGMTEACFATFSHHYFERLDDDVLPEAGKPVPGVSMRIVGDGGRLLNEGESGLLEINGPLVSRGYEGENGEVFTDDGWLRTGDLGFLRHGVLTITGRAKETIKIGGVAFSSREIEAAVEEVPNIDPAFTAACAVPTSQDAAEALAIFLRAPDDEVVHAVRARVVHRCGIMPRFVIPLQRDEFPTSAVGKIQRARLRERFVAGAFDAWRRWPYDLRASPPRDALPSDATAAERYLAKRIAAVIAEVLGVPVGVGDDFFALGVSSLRVVHAAALLAGVVPDRRCQIADLFHAPTALALAARLTRSAAPHATPQRSARPQKDAVAIVGMACRFPGAANVDEFWQLLRDGCDALTHFSVAELLAAGVDPSAVEHPSYVRAGMVLDDIESFDAEFFGIPAREAELMDPQQRLLLECAWEALEDAGHAPANG
ncbi:MAG: AMP-binding protein, partial [Thermoanaerobaculia bacterium]